MVTKRTIFNFFGGYYFCESTDEKPTNVKVNDRILELDTAREYFWDGTTWVLCGSVVYYPISATITNGTASGATKIATGQTAEVTIVPSSGYALPTSVTVEGATASYNATTGVITLSEVTGDVSITAACVAVYAISVSVTNGSYSGDTTILDGGTANVTIAADTDYVLPSSITVSGASYTYDMGTGVIALSTPTGAVSISAVCEVPSSYPVKGDIINIDMNGDGTDEEYLVLKSVGSDNVVEVLARANYSGSKFASSRQTYENQTLDIALNTTYYVTLSETAKSAIVDKTFRQDSWYSNNSVHHKVAPIDNAIAQARLTRSQAAYIVLALLLAGGGSLIYQFACASVFPLHRKLLLRFGCIVAEVDILARSEQMLQVFLIVPFGGIPSHIDNLDVQVPSAHIARFACNSDKLTDENALTELDFAYL